ncbi:MAG: hypothetical protein GF317_01100 [Candidatus Lokiarchaeota archaeon]|nr:hypothetical protein [Candidatus Lokiarchaeota archaeon]MBD3198556.1 hypothetical protein [Candidatus Lokiarchaeota archaeon]
MYCSNEEKDTLFETIIFIEKLIHSINPNNIWSINSIYFQNENEKERIVLKHIITEKGENLFYAICGKFNVHSEETYNMLQDFYNKVESTYSSIDSLRKAPENPMFGDMIDLATDFIKSKYDSIVKNEELKIQIGNIDLSFDEDNKILYCGISSQGLPIISRLYHVNFFNNLKSHANEENIEIFSSKLSAKLATIAMNSLIRANTNIKEIHITDLRDQTRKIVILFGYIKNFSLDFVASGDFELVHGAFKKLLDKISNEKILQKEFSGDLRPYKKLNKYLDNLVKEIEN